MKDSNYNDQFNTKLKIAFPKSNEDHRLQLIEINGSIFAVLHSALESQGPIRLYCEEWSLVLLSPIKSKTNIVISAKNILCFNEIESEEGLINLHASNKLVKFAHLIKPKEKVSEIVEGSEFQFDEDPGAFLYYSRLFHSIVSSIHTQTQEAFQEAQQKFIMSLCTLAEKVEGKTGDDLTLSKVLKVWSIPASVDQ